MRGKAIVFCSLCICYDNEYSFCKHCLSAQKISAHYESWRQLMYMHTKLHSETCLKWLSKAQTKLICRVQVALRKVKQFWFKKFQDIHEQSSKPGSLKMPGPYCSFHSSVLQPCNEPCTGRIWAGLRVMLI